MTIDDFRSMMACNEPDFSYNGHAYSICWPDCKYYVTASDSPGDIDLTFDSLDNLLDHWMIQGKSLRAILPDIQIND